MIVNLFFALVVGEIFIFSRTKTITAALQLGKVDYLRRRRRRRRRRPGNN
jgi:hypothetical protein